MNTDDIRLLAIQTDAEVLDLCARFAEDLRVSYLAGAPFPGWRPIGDRLHQECVRRGITRS